MKFLVTGAAGFIGYHVSKRLLSEGYQVIGIDNINSYYSVSLKLARLNRLIKKNSFSFYKLDLADKSSISNLFAKELFDRVIHLGAQAGVRHSLKDPFSYASSNLIGHLNILEGCKNNNVDHLIYASSSSVYGLNYKLPFSVKDSVDHPISFYAATKKSNELMSHSYSYLYKLPTTGLRFFTVYGPWGRPDMMLFKFTKAILTGKSIDIYNHGIMQRDFTYIDDVSEAIVRLQSVIPKSDINWRLEEESLATSPAPYRIYNIGNNKPIKIMDYIHALEIELGIQANRNFLPMQPGDLLKTSADITELYELIRFRPKTDIQNGIKNFVKWYRSYYNTVIKL